MKTILIVDDEAYFSKSIEEALDPKKFTVINAVNGEEGLKVLEKSPLPDAVLLDINMPVMNGLEFLKKLNEKKGPPSKVPIIITSNVSTRETIGEGVALGVRGYIIKSNETPRTIAETIESLFTQS